jgi:hypothetical protein
MNPGLLIIAAVVAYSFLKKNGTPAAVDVNAERQFIIDFMNMGGDTDANKKSFATMVNTQMTASEIDALYQYFSNYVSKGIDLPASSPLFPRVQAISYKYNIFT